MKRLLLLIPIFLYSLCSLAQGVPSDTTSYLLGANLDSWPAWSFSRQTGTMGAVSNFSGIEGNGLRVTYTFPASGGWVNLEIPMPAAYTKAHPMVFFIFTASSYGQLEIKFTDTDGSVFAVQPPLRSYAGKWAAVTTYLDNTSYAWGGNDTFGTPARFSLAISAQGAANGTVFFDQIGIGQPGLPSSFLPTIDPNSTLSGIGFAQRRDLALTPEDPLVLQYLKALQDQSTPDRQLVPTYKGGVQAQTFNNCLTTLAFIARDEKERAERILDFYLSATDSSNTDQMKQQFFYRGEARGFFQECDIHTLQAMGARNRWMGDMAWLLITCKNYQKKYDSNRYDYLVLLIKDLLISFYKEAGTGGYIQHGWENGDAQLHNTYGHHEGNIDAYVALKLCGEGRIALKIKTWLDSQLDGRTDLPLDLYTWRTLAFGAMGQKYISLLNIPEYDFRYRKSIEVGGRQVMGLFSHPDITLYNFWNDGTGHISCAFQAFGDRQRGFFYANQMDPLIVPQAMGTETTHGLPYTLNKQGYEGVDPAVPVVSSSAWYILAKNGCNPFLSEDFYEAPTEVQPAPFHRDPTLKALPNPFSHTVILYSTTKLSAPVKIYIFNNLGVKVKTLDFPVQPAGSSITWDATNDAGQKVMPGNYLIKMVSNRFTETIKVLFLNP